MLFVIHCGVCTATILQYRNVYDARRSACGGISFALLETCSTIIIIVLSQRPAAPSDTHVEYDYIAPRTPVMTSVCLGLVRANSRRSLYTKHVSVIRTARCKWSYAWYAYGIRIRKLAHGRSAVAFLFFRSSAHSARWRYVFLFSNPFRYHSIQYT